MTRDLFAGEPEPVGCLPGAVLLRGLALPYARTLARGLRIVTAVAPFRHMVTPGGFTMSVAMTNCGEVGWVSTRAGYRYTALDPERRVPWPAMPAAFAALARSAAAAAGYPRFAPDACLVNRYAPGTRLSLHRDRDERDLTQPIVSVSLGVTATFLWGELTRRQRPLRLPLAHGDVVVFGGPARLCYHGVAQVREAHHSFAGDARINLTFRRAQ